MPLEQLRMFLIVGMCLVTFLIWQAWVQDYGPKPPAQNEPVAAQSADGTTPPAASTTDGIPSSASSAATPTADPTAQIPSEAQTQVDPSAVVSVRTDLIETQLSVNGSSVQSINLLEYPVTSDNPDEPFTLLNPTRPNVFIAHTGVIGLGDLEFEAAGNEFILADGEETLEVSFVAKPSDALEVVKTYTFRRDSYVIDIRYDVKNTGDANWDGEMYSHFERTQVAPPGGLFRIYTYTGGVFFQRRRPLRQIRL